jgi:hypothetical protein
LSALICAIGATLYYQGGGFIGSGGELFGIFLVGFSSDFTVGTFLDTLKPKHG